MRVTAVRQIVRIWAAILVVYAMVLASAALALAGPFPTPAGVTCLGATGNGDPGPSGDGHHTSALACCLSCGPSILGLAPDIAELPAPVGQPVGSATAILCGLTDRASGSRPQNPRAPPAAV
jgi:hypothetical protein